MAAILFEAAFRPGSMKVFEGIGLQKHCATFFQTSACRCFSFGLAVVACNLTEKQGTTEHILEETQHKLLTMKVLGAETYHFQQTCFRFSPRVASPTAPQFGSQAR